MTTSARRYVGANEWQSQLDQIANLNQRLIEEITEMSQYATTTESARRHTKMIGYSSQAAITALSLKGYKVRDEQTTT